MLRIARNGMPFGHPYPFHCDPPLERRHPLVAATYRLLLYDTRILYDSVTVAMDLW